MPRLIFLDDDRIQHLLMRKLFQFHLPDWDFEFFENARDAKVWLSQNPVDLIISDLNLDTESGWDFVKEIGEYSETPVVFLTSNISPEDSQKKEQFSQVKLLLEKPLEESGFAQILEVLQS
ncbi:response regulator [Algoriphagus limi]|uniref:Response regulator n=1 Tax=Algoriphagus limi TaxID=2975273 RepID=A0ABT2G948_9BACT|nr:response regulator [Algoriphagus limi]MCS5491805.1 response regulator [Algoriphagus limi]